jgi:putative FmdB family regulatory protein
MPTYDYRCPQGHEFELVQKMTARPQAMCPRCGRTAVRQLSGGAGLIFKGSGFYITDYGKDGKGPRKDSEGGAKTPEPAVEAKSESKAPDPKPEPEKPAKKKAKP